MVGTAPPSTSGEAPFEAPPPVTRTIAAFAAALDFSALPRAVVDHAGLRVLEVLGLCLAGATCEPAAAVVADWVGEEGGRPESTLVGFGRKGPAARAALVNGVAAECLQYSDLHMPRSGVHPGPPVVAAALAIAEARGGSGRDLLVGVVAGLETLVRLGNAARGVLPVRGFHATGVCGPFAAAVAAGRIMGLPAQIHTHALGIAGTMAAGSMEFRSNGSQAHQLNAGWAAHHGVVAATLAERGITGPETALEGPSGFFRAYADHTAVDAGALTERLGEDWELLKIVSKPYPVCNLAGACIEAAGQLVGSWSGRAEDVEEIVCAVTPRVVPMLCEPPDPTYHPRSPYGAKFSLPYLVALAALEGTPRLAHFAAPGCPDPRLEALAQRVRWVVVPERPVHWGQVTIRTRDGAERSADVALPRYTLERALTPAEVRDKFYETAGTRVPRDRAEQIQAAVERLVDLPSLEPLTALLR